MAYTFRDGEQCWSYTGSWQGVGCGSKINSSFATAPSVTRDISWTCTRGHMDAGMLFAWCFSCAFILDINPFENTNSFHWLVSYSFLVLCRNLTFKDHQRLLVVDHSQTLTGAHLHTYNVTWQICELYNLSK